MLSTLLNLHLHLHQSHNLQNKRILAIQKSVQPVLKIILFVQNARKIMCLAQELTYVFQEKNMKIVVTLFQLSSQFLILYLSFSSLVSGCGTPVQITRHIRISLNKTLNSQVLRKQTTFSTLPSRWFELERQAKRQVNTMLRACEAVKLNLIQWLCQEITTSKDLKLIINNNQISLDSSLIIITTIKWIIWTRILLTIIISWCRQVLLLLELRTAFQNKRTTMEWLRTI